MGRSNELMLSYFSETLMEPFAYTFMQQAFLMVALVSIPTAILSCFLVLKGWSLMGDAISHSVLPGVILAYIGGFSFAIGAFGAGMLCAVFTGFLKENSRLKEDTIMGVVFSGMFAVGLVMMTKVDSNIHLDHILFGDVLGLSWHNILETAGVTALVLSCIFFKGKDLLVFVFDQQHAKALGLPVTLLHYGLLSLLSLTIVAALKAVGMILVIAMLITPGAVAHLLTKKFRRMILLSIIISISAAFLGVYISFYIDSAPAPTIIVLLTLLFVIVFIYQDLRSVRWQGDSDTRKPSRMVRIFQSD